MTSINEPRLCSWDIETSYSLLAGFDLYNQNHSHKDIVQEWYIISAAWKYLGDDQVHSITADGKDDRRVVEKLYEVLDKVDILIHHNGDKFDIKKLKARAIQLKMPPLKPVTTIDTLKVARKEFKFTSNRLDYLARYLGVGKKRDTPSGLWLSVLMGDQEAVAEMESYNRQDVVILEEVYKELKPWMKNHPSLKLFTQDSDRGCCQNCGSSSLTREGYRTTKTKRYPRYRCKDCGAWKMGSTVTEEVEV